MGILGRIITSLWLCFVILLSPADIAAQKAIFFGQNTVPILPGTDMALLCTASILNDASATTLQTPSTNCVGANTFVYGYEEGGNSSLTPTDTVGCTWVTPTNFTVVLSGALFDAVASNCTGTSNFQLTIASGSAEPFRRLMLHGYSNGNVAGAIDGNGAVASSAAGPPATTANITQSALGGVIVHFVSNNDGSTCIFSSNNGFSLNFGTTGVAAGHDTDSQIKLNTNTAQTPSMGMTADGAAWRSVAVPLKK